MAPGEFYHFWLDQATYIWNLTWIEQLWLFRYRPGFLPKEQEKDEALTLSKDLLLRQHTHIHFLYCHSCCRKEIPSPASQRWCLEADQAQDVVNAAERRFGYVRPDLVCASDVTGPQCDQVRPACSQCLKSKDGAPCPGYRDQQALKFLDESSQVALKVQRKQLSKPGRQEYGSETSNSSSDSASSSPPGSDESPLSSALAPSLENQGIRYFIANYVMPDSDLCSGHLQNLLSFKTTQSKTIQVAMEAAGLAGLSNSTNNPSLMAKARQQYAMALRMTKAHLADPSRCKQDRTFTAVALLGLFEVWNISHG